MRRHKFELQSTIADIRFLFFYVSNYTRIAAALVSCYGFIIVAAAVIVLGQGHCFCGLFYCPLKGYKAIHARPYENCYPTPRKKLFLLCKLQRKRLVIFANSTYQYFLIWVVCCTEEKLAFVVALWNKRRSQWMNIKKKRDNDNNKRLYCCGFLNPNWFQTLP